MRNLIRYSGTLVALVLVIACSSSGGFVNLRSSGALGGANPSTYIGTFSLTYTGTVGSCGASALPTALNITATAPGTSSDGQAVTLLTGNVVGGLLDGVPFANMIPPGPTVQSPYPTAYVQNSNGVFQINVFSGYAPLEHSLKDLYLVVAFGGIGSANVETSTCEEGVVQAFIHEPT